MRVVLLVVFIAAALRPTAGQGNCRLISSTWEPTPALEQCFPFNREACCVSGHDAVIQQEFNALFSENCQLLFQDLSTYFCLACSPAQEFFVNETARTINICQPFAERLYTFTMYDTCGLLIPSVDNGVVIPSRLMDNGEPVFSNTTTFLNYQAPDGSYPLRPTFYKDYSVVVVNPQVVDCFTSGALRALANTLAVMLCVIVALWNAASTA